METEESNWLGKCLVPGSLTSLTGPKASFKTFLSLWMGLNWLLDNLLNSPDSFHKLLIINILDEINVNFILLITLKLLKILEIKSLSLETVLK